MPDLNHAVGILRPSNQSVIPAHSGEVCIHHVFPEMSSNDGGELVASLCSQGHRFLTLGTGMYVAAWCPPQEAAWRS